MALIILQVLLLHPPLPLVGVSIGQERECQQNDSGGLAAGAAAGPAPSHGRRPDRRAVGARWLSGGSVDWDGGPGHLGVGPHPAVHHDCARHAR